MAFKKSEKEQAYKGMLDAVKRVADSRKALEKEKEKLKKDIHDRVQNKPKPVTGFDIADVASDIDNRPIEQMWEKIRRIDAALGSPNAIDADYRKHSAFYMECFAEEVATEYERIDKEIDAAKAQIEDAKAQIRALEKEKAGKAEAACAHLAECGFGSLSYRFYKWANPRVFAERYRNFCDRLDSGEFIHPNEWSSSF